MSALTASLQHHRRDDSKLESTSHPPPSAMTSSTASLQQPPASASASSGTIASTAAATSGSNSAYHSIIEPRLSPAELQDLADRYADALISSSTQQQQQASSSSSNIIGFLICSTSSVDSSSAVEVLRSYGTLDADSSETQQGSSGTSSGTSNQIASLAYHILLNVQSMITTNQQYQSEENSNGNVNQRDSYEALERVSVTFKRETYVVTLTGHGLIIVVQQGGSEGKG